MSMEIESVDRKLEHQEMDHSTEMLKSVESEISTDDEISIDALTENCSPAESTEDEASALSLTTPDLPAGTIPVPTNDSANDSLDKIVSTLEVLIMMEEQRTNEQRNLFERMQNRLDRIEELAANSGSSDSSGSSGISSSSYLNQGSSEDDKKKSILAEYGLLDDDEDQDSDSRENASESNVSTAPEIDPIDLEAIKAQAKEEAMLELLDGADAAEVHALKEELKKKIREMEVELSIRRSKLEQREAIMDERGSTLDAREQRFKENIEQVKNPETKSMLGRLKQHLQVLSNAKAENEPKE